MWVRGLKLGANRYQNHSKAVAPRVGAWIETYIHPTEVVAHESHPVWVRGLKLVYIVPDDTTLMSHPVWVRGLKRKTMNTRIAFETVAPRVGAWIETGNAQGIASPGQSRTPCGCVD